MSTTIEVIEPGTRARTVSGAIPGFITSAKIGKTQGGFVVFYEFSYFSSDGYRQVWLEDFEFDTEEVFDTIKIGFKN